MKAMKTLAAMVVVLGVTAPATAELVYGTSSSNGGSVIVYDTTAHTNSNLLTGLGSPSGLTFGPDGHLFVAERIGSTSSYRIEEYSQGGADLGTFATGLTSSFRGIGLAFDGSGNLYATESGVIHEFYAAGGGRDLAAPSSFLPYQLATFGSNLYATNFGSTQVYVYDMSSATPTPSVFATLSGASGRGVATDAAGNVYVSSGSGTFKFDSSGNPIDNPSTLGPPFSTTSGYGLALGTDALYVVNPSSLYAIDPATGAGGSTSGFFPSTEYIATPPVSVVPEPASGVALLIGAATLGLAARLRRRG